MISVTRVDAGFAGVGAGWLKVRKGFLIDHRLTSLGKIGNGIPVDIQPAECITSRA
ncbi:MAG: hypothetical protein ACRCVN_04705 [Spirochaetia bacterium]